MSLLNNAKLVPAVTPFANGAVYLDTQVTNLASPGFWPAAIAVGDQIQIGEVPAGAVLIPWLSNIQLPVLDSGPAGTLSVSLGTQATPAALKATAAAEAATNVPGSSLSATALIGDPVNPTPIYITATAAAVAAAQTGRIVANLAFRAWRDDTDLGFQTP
jgi:hypothetical protein